MPKRKLWKSPDLVPAIVCADVPGTVAWLERVFGFRERASARLTWPAGVIAWMEAGDALLSLMTADALQRQVAGGAVRGLVLKVYVDDVDAHFARAKAEGAAIVGEPEDGFWGGRIYRARDPEGHLWEISQRGRDLPAEAWELPPGVRRGKPK